MPDSFGKPYPWENTDLSIGNQATDNTFGAQFNTPSLDNVTGPQSFETQGIDTNVLNVPQVGQEQSSWSDNFFSNKEGGTGWGTAAIGAGTGLAQTYMGFQQLKEGKKQNRIANQQWQDQFDIQKGEYDRQANERSDRVAANKANAQAASLGA